MSDAVLAVGLLLAERTSEAKRYRLVMDRFISTARLAPIVVASAGLFIAGLSAAGCQSTSPPGSVATKANYSATVTRVVDGDTIVVKYSDGRSDKVRFIGVDTPETHKPGTPIQCFGPEAERFTRAQLAGRRIGLELDREPRDRYGRLLAYIYLNGQRFEDTLLKLGYARQLTIRPNNRYARDLLALSIDAKRARRGLWNTCE